LYDLYDLYVTKLILANRVAHEHHHHSCQVHSSAQFSLALSAPLVKEERSCPTTSL
jgi:hypothetical protein